MATMRAPKEEPKVRPVPTIPDRTKIRIEVGDQVLETTYVDLRLDPGSVAAVLSRAGRAGEALAALLNPEAVPLVSATFTATLESVQVKGRRAKLVIAADNLPSDKAWALWRLSGSGVIAQIDDIQLGLPLPREDVEQTHLEGTGWTAPDQQG